MKIYTLGTSHGDSTMTRFNTSTAYQAQSGAVYLVDCGAPCEALLRRKGLRVQDVRAVFLTHLHIDHTAGLISLTKQCTKYPGDRVVPMQVHLPEEEAIPALKNWLRALHEDPDHRLLHFTASHVGPLYEDDSIAVSAIRTRHLVNSAGEPSSFAYVLHFKQENLTVLHTGDLRGDFADYPQEAQTQHFDVCLCEATHYPPESAQPVLKTAQLDHLIFIHIADRWHLPGGEDALLNCFADMPYPVRVAHDGDEFVFQPKNNPQHTLFCDSAPANRV